jgi:uncharacterized protein
LSAPALLCDTGALLSYLDARSPDHAAYRAAIDAARARYVPGLVLAELDYFLAGDRPAMRAFVSDLERRAFLYAPPTDSQLTRAMHVDQRYSRLCLGLVDATIVALAEELGVVRTALFRAGIRRLPPIEVPNTSPGPRTDLGRAATGTKLAPNPSDPLYFETAVLLRDGRHATG